MRPGKRRGIFADWPFKACRDGFRFSKNTLQRSLITLESKQFKHSWWMSGTADHDQRGLVGVWCLGMSWSRRFERSLALSVAKEPSLEARGGS